MDMEFLENQLRGTPQVSPINIAKPALLIVEFAFQLTVFNYNSMLIKLILYHRLSCY